jgi:hypothetical protein
MQANLKRLHSSDVRDFKSFQPEMADDFGFLLQAMIGPTGAYGEESFDFQVCTPKWLERHHGKSAIVAGRHYLLVFEYNFQRLSDFISAFCTACAGGIWQEIAVQLGRLGKWEFEDYQPTPTE